jgi:hypothetical protein
VVFGHLQADGGGDMLSKNFVFREGAERRGRADERNPPLRRDGCVEEIMAFKGRLRIAGKDEVIVERVEQRLKFTLRCHLEPDIPKRPFGKSAVRDSLPGGVMIQALDVDRTEPWPDGQDRQEDQALPV